MRRFSKHESHIMTNHTLAQAEVTISDAALLLEDYTEAGDNVFLWGVPGIGKTDIVHQLAARKKRRVIEFHAALREPVDLRGIPSPDHKTMTTKWFTPDELPQAKRDGEEGYLFLDEFNQASPQMQAVLAGLVLYGVIGDYSLPSGWRCVAAGNRVSDRAAAQRMPTHMRNRFAHVYCVPDVIAWTNWATANGVAPEMVAFIRLRRELIHRMPRGDENAFPTPRSLTKAAKYIDANDSRRLRLFAGLIGDDVAAELNGFIRLYRSLGSLEDIVANPDRAKIPTEPSERWAVCTGLARLADRKNFSQIMKYAERLDGEPAMLLVHDATVIKPELKQTAAYSKWAVDHSDLILQ
jgi:MoxR-like ATPase